MLLYFLQEKISLITLRAAMAAVLAFLLAILIGPRVIAFLKGKKVGEKTEKKDSERLDKIQSHKKDTPTMGGIFIVASIVISVLLFGNFENRINWIVLLVVIGMGLVGWTDDYLKLSGKSRKGMKLSVKFGLQIAIGLAAGYLLKEELMGGRDSVIATNLYFPLLSKLSIHWGDVVYPFFVAFVIVSCSNAVNITDGLDGLAAGCMVIAAFAYGVIAYVAGRADFTTYLEIPFVRSSAEMTVTCTAVLGACLGFLWFNCYPAQIFMGDVGALPLGALLGLVACVTKQELLLLLVGGVFVIEVFSSLAQIVAFRFFGRRIFLIAPLHHHYQFKNLPESKIVLRFWIVGAILAVASLATLKMKY